MAIRIYLFLVMTHYGSQEQNRTCHLVNIYKKCAKKGGLTKIKIPIRQEKKYFPLFLLYQT